MKKYVYLAISIIMLILAIVSVVCAVTVTGSGFLDLSNIARGVFIVIAIICILIAWLIFSKFKKS
ncbi:MAG: hypothetical protein IJ374_09100 [Lachnospiraceae bacterium]|nr:hypothetical protein [Lachnospiraceae bacterium]